MGLNITKLFAVDVTKENEGVWLDIGEGIQVKVAAEGNQNYQKFFEDAVTPIRTSAAKMPQSFWDDLTAKARANTILLDWKGVTDDSGAEVAYTADQGIPLFAERANHVIAELIISKARDQSSYKAEEVAAKN